MKLRAENLSFLLQSGRASPERSAALLLSQRGEAFE